MTELFELSACEMVARLKSSEVSIAEALDALSERIEAVDSSINALPTLCFDRAHERAVALQSKPVAQRGKLCGLPVTIKDLTPVSGVRTTFGSAVFKDHIAAVSDQLVTRIERDGGIVYAKSNTPEFGAGGITYNDVFGITRSPHNLECSSGGSSGGAAASLAAGCAWLSHGSDMAGSLRTPAAFCGVTSLRPSPGTIKSDSEYLPFQVLGAEGPMARCIEDLALFADVMRDDHLDGSIQQSLERVSQAPLSHASVAVSHDLGICEISSEVSDAFGQFVERIIAQCTNVVDTHPDLRGVHESFDTLRALQYAVGLEQAVERHSVTIKPEVVWNVERGLSQSSLQICDALRRQGQIVSRAARFMQDYDVLICPATSIGSVQAELRYPGEHSGVPIPEYYRWLAIAYATTMTSLPIITLPVSTLGNGMPFAVQLIGKPHAEAALFQVARQIESLSSWQATTFMPQ